MQLAVGLAQGGIAFAANAVAVTYRIEVERGQSGRPMRNRVAVDAKGQVYGNGQVELAALEKLVREVLSTPYLDLTFTTDSGTQTPISLINAETLSGVVVTDGPHWEIPDGPEFVSMRTFRFTADAVYQASPANALVSFQQTVSFQGNGGPRKVWRFPINGPPIRQVVTPYSLTRVTQSGRAVGHLVRPSPPALVLPDDYLVNEQVSVTETIGRPIGPGVWIEPSVQWTFPFETIGVPSYTFDLPVM